MTPRLLRKIFQDNSAVAFTAPTANSSMGRLEITPNSGKIIFPIPRDEKIDLDTGIRFHGMTMFERCALTITSPSLCSLEIIMHKSSGHSPNIDRIISSYKQALEDSLGVIADALPGMPLRLDTRTLTMEGRCLTVTGSLHEVMGYLKGLANGKIDEYADKILCRKLPPALETLAAD